jgi:hypothetical protein
MQGSENRGDGVLAIVRIIALALAAASFFLAAREWFPFCLESTALRYLLLVFVLPYLFLFVSHSPMVLLRAIRELATSGHAADSQGRRDDGRSAFQALGRYTLCIGVAGSYISWSQGLFYCMEHYRGAPQWPDLAGPFGCSLLFPVTALLLYLFLYPFLVDALNRPNPAAEPAGIAGPRGPSEGGSPGAEGARDEEKA